MLCDDLVTNHEFPTLYDDMDKMLAKIERAQKFVLSCEFAVAADGLVDNIPELNKIAPWCRVPYPLCWFEWLHDERPHWNPDGPYDARPVDPTRHQLPPHRVGLLMEQHERASHWKTHLFWSLRGTANICPYNGSLGAQWFDAEKCKGAAEPLEAALEPDLADFGHDLVARLAQRAPDVLKQLGIYAIEDWGGEVRFMIAVLGLLNLRNVATVEKIDHSVMNAKRKRHGKRELFSHHVLKVRPSLIRRVGGGGPNGHRDLRMHTVRGHIKERTSGPYWWSAHVRGSIETGMVSKDYEVI